MKLVKLSLESNLSIHEFIRYWSVFYNYPLDSIYLDRVKKNKYTPDDLDKLYIWKNGTPLSERKNDTLKLIIDKIDIINELKVTFNLDIFHSNFSFLSAIWKIYLLHIIKPEKYPIFDQHVCRALYFLTEYIIKEIPNTNVAKERIYFRNYVEFFNNLAVKGVKRKKLDEALWAFGKFLKTEYGREVSKNYHITS